MFFDFGAGEIIGLLVLAVILIGPERLPHFAVDAAKFVKRVREIATTATSELKENLGPGFEDYDIFIWNTGDVEFRVPFLCIHCFPCNSLS